MASVSIKQRIHAPIDTVFAAITDPKTLEGASPFIQVDLVKTSENGTAGLDSVRAMGLGPLKPLKEKVTVFEPPHRMEYKIVGLVSKLIRYHHGAVTFTPENNGKDTLVVWHIQMKTNVPFASDLILKSIKQGVARALSKQAKKLKQAA